MLLVDTNALLAAADRLSPDHQRCASLLDVRTDIAVPTTVATECTWMVELRLGAVAEATFVRSVASVEPPTIELLPEDWARCADLIETCHDRGLGVVDAWLVAVAEHLGQQIIATLNRRDLAVVRPPHTAAFELIS